MLTCKITGHKWNGCKCIRCGQKRDIEHDWTGCTCRVCGKKRYKEHIWKQAKNDCLMVCSVCGISRKTAIWEYASGIKNGKLEGFAAQAVKCYCKQVTEESDGSSLYINQLPMYLRSGRFGNKDLSYLFEVKANPIKPATVEYEYVEKLIDVFSATPLIMKKYQFERSKAVGSIAVVLAAFPEFSSDLTKFILTKTENSSNPVKNAVYNQLYYNDFSSTIDISETEFDYSILKVLYSYGIQRVLIETFCGKSYGNKPFYYKSTFDHYTAIPFLLNEQRAK